MADGLLDVAGQQLDGREGGLQAVHPRRQRVAVRHVHVHVHRVVASAAVTPRTPAETYREML